MRTPASRGLLRGEEGSGPHRGGIDPILTREPHGLQSPEDVYFRTNCRNQRRQDLAARCATN